jgi:hypothetical protein
MNGMRSTIVALLLLVCFGSSADAQLLWRVDGNGLKSPSYILGTHHLAPFSVLDSIAGIREAMKNTTQVVGELVMTDAQKPESVELMQKMMVAQGDTTLQMLLTPEEYSMVNAATNEYLNFDIGTMPRVKPSFIENNLTVMMYAKLIGGYNPADQLDAYFQSFAVRHGRKVVGLETPEFQFGLLYNSQSLKRQAELLVCLLRNVDRTMDDARRLNSLYMHQDLDGMLSLSEHIEGDSCDPLPAETDIMVGHRNVDWAEKLPSIMAEEPALIVVGALHLPGEQGLLSLLRAKGYSVKPMK